jgi:hypothetical protein
VDPLSSPNATVTAGTLERSYGVSAESLDVLRALADIIAPAVDGCPAAGDVQAHLRAAQSLEMLQRGSTTLLTRMVNMYARAQRRGARFLELNPAERERVLRELAAEDGDDMCDLVEGLHTFILNGYLAGWSSTVPWQQPEPWNVMGFHGTANGHLDMVTRSETAGPTGGDRVA